MVNAVEALRCHAQSMEAKRNAAALAATTDDATKKKATAKEEKEKKEKKEKRADKEKAKEKKDKTDKRDKTDEKDKKGKPESDKQVEGTTNQVHNPESDTQVEGTTNQKHHPESDKQVDGATKGGEGKADDKNTKRKHEHDVLEVARPLKQPRGGNAEKAPTIWPTQHGPDRGDTSEMMAVDAESTDNAGAAVDVDRGPWDAESTDKAGAAVLAGPGTGSSSNDKEGVLAKKPLYNISTEVRDLILAAASPGDIPKAERNKVYEGLRRLMTSHPDEVPAPVLARYNADKENGKIFSFVKDWAKDLTFGTMVCHETHVMNNDKWAEQEYEWYTEQDLQLKWHVWEWPEGKQYCEDLIKGAKSKPHIDPQHRKNPKMKLYRVLKSLAEGAKKSFNQQSGMTYSAEVSKDSNRHDTFLELAKKRSKMICNVGDPADEDAGVKKPRETKQPKAPKDGEVQPTTKTTKTTKQKGTLADRTHGMVRETMLELQQVSADLEASKTPIHHKACAHPGSTHTNRDKHQHTRETARP